MGIVCKVLGKFKNNKKAGTQFLPLCISNEFAIKQKFRNS